MDPANPGAGTKFLAPEKLRGMGAVLLDARGQRFVDELTTRDKVASVSPGGRHFHPSFERAVDGP